MRRRLRATAIAGALLCGARSAHGQASASAELGSARLDQPGSASSGVATFGGELGVSSARGSIVLDALGAQGSHGNGTGQATLTALLLVPSPGHSALELSAVGTAFGANAQLPVTSLQLAAKQYLSTPTAGLFYGVGGGLSAWAAASLPVATGEVGSWWRHGPDQFSVATELTFTQSEFRTPTSSGEQRTVFDVRYAEVATGWQRWLGRATLSASAGARLGIDNVTARSAWVTAGATYAILSHLSVVAAAGRTPADYVRGVPESRFVALSLRIGARGASRPRPGGDSVRGPILTIDGGVDHHTVHVRAPSASRVEVMADFTEWQPVELTAGPAGWTLDLAISSGLHRVLIRVNGGAWMVPPNLTRGRGDFGSDVGLITVL